MFINYILVFYSRILLSEEDMRIYVKYNQITSCLSLRDIYMYFFTLKIIWSFYRLPIMFKTIK